MTQAVLDGVRDLLPGLRERADEAERLRVVPDANIKELEETGFFKLLQPRRFDGFEADPVDFYTAVRDIASACGSTGRSASSARIGSAWSTAPSSSRRYQTGIGTPKNRWREMSQSPERPPTQFS